MILRSFGRRNECFGQSGPLVRKCETSGKLDAALLTDQMTYLPNDLLVKVDIASMANSLEAALAFS